MKNPGDTIKIRTKTKIESKIRTLINIIVTEWKIRFSSSLLSSRATLLRACTASASQQSSCLLENTGLSKGI